MNWRSLLLLVVATGASGAPLAGPALVKFGAAVAPPPSSASAGFSLLAGETGPQLGILGRSGFLVSVRPGEEVETLIPVEGLSNRYGVVVEATVSAGTAEVMLVAGGKTEAQSRSASPPAGQRTAGVRPTAQTVRLELSELASATKPTVRLVTRGKGGEATVAWRRLEIRSAAVGDPAVARLEIVWPKARQDGSGAPPSMPSLRRGLEEALMEWDWRMQDGIGTERAPSSYPVATEQTLKRGDRLLRELERAGVLLPEETARWDGLWREWRELSGAPEPDWPAQREARQSQWEELWRQAHWARRQIVFRNPLAKLGPLVFAKQVPSCFSHQLTQYYGGSAQPGGGIFVLEAPGESLRCRPLAANALPVGSYQHPEVSFDGRRVLFAYCRAETVPPNRETYLDRFYHLYEVNADGSGLRQMTDGAFDDFSPRCLPNDQIMFLSTRRGGFHRCGRGPCATYALALANGDGSNPRPISFHETHEWDPCVLNDGRVIYTRWDYVDRHAVHYQQLWTVRPDGTDPRAFYGNNTLSPVGVWEARPVPGSSLVMATAAAHHAMTAGSIILLDVTQGVDGPAPIRRLTPDALFPESEEAVSNGRQPAWYDPVGVPKPPAIPVEVTRWPGHCYRSPYPLAENYFIAAYSFDRLIGEPAANPANMFGLYLVDAFGNKELLYRDVNLSSQWAMPLRPRARPPVLPSTLEDDGQREGKFFMENVYAGWPSLPAGAVKRLRVLQVVPKSTPHANDPTVGLANASPGKQVLGTVPVEADGSAWFRAPAGLALAFQALDERGQALQIMRSVTYLQSGETASCVGCHEHRATAPTRRTSLAQRREPSRLEPGPDGSKPLSYPLLVQPVLDQHCVRCHNEREPGGKVVLTGQPQGRYSVSYNALAPRVRYSAWGVPGDFRQSNSEPVTYPGFFGARGSPLMRYLLPAHEKVELNAQDWERLVTWMDANALFYGTFDPADQARQLRGEHIAGPKVD